MSSNQTAVGLHQPRCPLCEEEGWWSDYRYVNTVALMGGTVAQELHCTRGHKWFEADGMRLTRQPGASRYKKHPWRVL